MINKKHKFKGIQYKSTGEFEIAKFLTKLGIEFEYEFPIAIVDDEKAKLWYPDFYLKEYQVVIEYFGMYNHNKGYKDNADHKKEVYKDCGIQFVPIYQLNKKWEEYLLKTILTHQEIKAKKMTEIMEEYTKSNKSFLKNINWKFWKKEDNKEEIKKTNKNQNNKSNNNKNTRYKKPEEKINKNSREYKSNFKTDVEVDHNPNNQKKRSKRI